MLEIYLLDYTQTHQVVPSHMHPRHHFHRRYISGGNDETGFNAMVPKMIGYGHDLYWVFEQLREVFDMRSMMHLTSGQHIRAMTRARELAARLRATLTSGPFDSFSHANIRKFQEYPHEQRYPFIQGAMIATEFCDEAVDLIRTNGSCYVDWRE